MKFATLFNGLYWLVDFRLEGFVQLYSFIPFVYVELVDERDRQHSFRDSVENIQICILLVQLLRKCWFCNFLFCVKYVS